MPLAEHFLDMFCGQIGKLRPAIPLATRERLLADPWGGNVRELQNTIERAVILLQGDELSPDLIRKGFGSPTRTPSSPLSVEGFQIPEANFSLEEHEKMLIRQALERAHYKKSLAARMLGLSRATLRYRMEKFGFSDVRGDEDGEEEGESEAPLPGSSRPRA